MGFGENKLPFNDMICGNGDASYQHYDLPCQLQQNGLACGKTIANVIPNYHNNLTLRIMMFADPWGCNYSSLFIFCDWNTLPHSAER